MDAGFGISQTDQAQIPESHAHTEPLEMVVAGRISKLVLMLLAVFGLIFGGSDHARQRSTEQLQYLIDPSGIRVIQELPLTRRKPRKPGKNLPLTARMTAFVAINHWNFLASTNPWSPPGV
jgi:hypothetical protein